MPLPEAPVLADQVGVGPFVLKIKVPVEVSSAFSETKLAVESAQSVP